MAEIEEQLTEKELKKVSLIMLKSGDFFSLDLKCTKLFRVLANKVEFVNGTVWNSVLMSNSGFFAVDVAGIGSSFDLHSFPCGIKVYQCELLPGSKYNIIIV